MSETKDALRKDLFHGVGYSLLMPARWGWMIGLKCDPYQTQSIGLYGDWSHAEGNVLRSLIKPGDFIIDAGANIGAHTIPMAMQVGPAGAVLAFEPQGIVFQCLCGNIVLNSASTVAQPFRAALGRQQGMIEVPVIDPTKYNVLGGVRLGDDYSKKHITALGYEQVRVMTVDQFNLPQLNLFKVDVEGMEADVIAGAAETIRMCKPTIWAEAIMAKEYEVNNEALKAELVALGYKAWRVITPIFSKANIRGTVINPYDDQADHNILAIPKETEPPAWISQAQCPPFCGVDEPAPAAPVSDTLKENFRDKMYED
jgi:FkbM family methyltransferase